MLGTDFVEVMEQLDQRFGPFVRKQPPGAFDRERLTWRRSPPQVCFVTGQHIGGDRTDGFGHGGVSEIEIVGCHGELILVDGQANFTLERRRKSTDTAKKLNGFQSYFPI